MANIERMRGQLRSMGAMWAWDREAVSCCPSYYKWTQWFFLQALRHGAGLPQVRAGGLLPEVQHDPGARAGLGRRPALRALRHAGDQEGAGAVVLQDHRLCRRAAATSTRSTGRSASGPCRPTGSAAARAPRSPSSPKQGDHDRGLHHPARHAVGRDLHGAGARASAGGQADDRGAAAGGARPTSSRPAGRPRSSAPRPTRRRPASSPAPTPSTRSTASASRSGSPTMC